MRESKRERARTIENERVSECKKERGRLGIKEERERAREERQKEKVREREIIFYSFTFPLRDRTG